MASMIRYPVGGHVDFTVASDDVARQFQPGDCGMGDEGSEWIYVQAQSAITKYNLVTVDADFGAHQATEARVATGKIIGIAPVALAAGDYGWIQVRGKASLRVKADCAATIVLYATTTSGVPDDAGTTKIGGIHTQSANAVAATNTVTVLMASSPHAYS